MIDPEEDERELDDERAREEAMDRGQDPDDPDPMDLAPHGMGEDDDENDDTGDDGDNHGDEEDD